MMVKKLGMGIMILVLLMTSLGCSSNDKKDVQGPEKAKGNLKVTIIGYGVGTAAYVFTASISEAVQKTSQIETRVVPAGNDVARLMPLRKGEANFAIFTGASGWIASRGVEDFAAEEWGPQPIRMLWRGGNLFNGFFTKGDSMIKSPKDLKGTKGAFIPGAATQNSMNQAIVAFAGLKKEDLQWKNFPSHPLAGQAVIDGAVDWHSFGTTGDKPTELASSPSGIRWLELDFKDAEGWERLYKILPFVSKGLCDRGAGITKEKPVQTITYPYPLWTYGNKNEEAAYQYAKAIWASYDIYKSMHPELIYWDHKTALDTSGCLYPFDNGTVKFFKEIGVWTKELEKFQNEQLEKENARMNLWNEAKKEAASKKIAIGSPEFKKFWYNKLEENNMLR